MFDISIYLHATLKSPIFSTTQISLLNISQTLILLKLLGLILRPLKYKTLRYVVQIRVLVSEYYTRRLLGIKSAFLSQNTRILAYQNMQCATAASSSLKAH